MPDVSIALSAKDNYSQVLTKLANETRTGANSVDGLQKSLSKLNATKVDLKTNMTKVKEELREAEKAFKKCGDAQSEAAYKAKQSEYDTLSSQFKAVSTSAKAAERDILSLSGTNSKISNRMSGSGGGNSIGGGVSGANGGSLLSALAGAGLGNMLGQSVQGLANTLIGSAYGDTAGSAISAVLGSAISGAAMGSLAGPVGAAVGAGIGAIAGGINAASEVFTKKDDAFKDYVQSQTEAALQEQAETLTSGSSVASTRETDLISFSTLFGGKGAAEGYLEQLKTMANSTPFLYGDLTSMSKTLKTFGYSIDEMIPKLTAVGDAGASLGMTTSDMSMVATALGRMKSSDKTSLEYINILQERGIDAVGALAGAKGVSKGKIYDMISGNKIKGTDADKIITEYLKKTYGGAMEQQSHTFSGLSSTLEGWNQEMQNAMGEGYNEGRKKGLDNQIDFLSGETGTKMQEAYALMGEFQADLENQREKLQRDALSAVMDGVMPEGSFEGVKDRLQEMRDEYIGALNTVNDDTAGTGEQQEARATMGRLLAEAQVMAESEYNASDGAQIVLDSQMTLAQRVASDTSNDSTYYDAGLRLGQQYTKGITAAINAYQPPAVSVPAVAGVGAGDGYNTAEAFPSDDKPAAIGENRVPRDNMLYLLHEGERVLPARDARRQDNGGGIVQVGGTYVVRQDSDIDAITEGVARKVLTAMQTLRPV